MSLLNGFLYLMLLLAGLSTALILLDLKRREDEAYARLHALYASQQDNRSSQGGLANLGKYNRQLSGLPSVKSVSSKEPVRLTAFFDMEDRSRSNQTTAQVSYDFAMQAKAPAYKRAISDQAAFNSETSCCA